MPFWLERRVGEWIEMDVWQVLRAWGGEDGEGQAQPDALMAS